MEHPDLLLDLYQLQHQDRLRKVETWRLVMTARQNRAKYMGYLLQRLVVAARQRLQVQARPNSVTLDPGRLTPIMEETGTGLNLPHYGELP